MSLSFTLCKRGPKIASPERVTEGLADDAVSVRHKATETAPICTGPLQAISNIKLVGKIQQKLRDFGTTVRTRRPDGKADS